MPTQFVRTPVSTLFCSDLQPIAKLILVCLRFWDRNTGRGCFASKQTMATMIGISLHQLRKGLKELREKDFIYIERRGQGNTDRIFVCEIDESLETKKSASDTIPIIGNKKVELDAKPTSNEVETENNTTVVDAKTKRFREKVEALVGVMKYEMWWKDTLLEFEDAEKMVIVVPDAISLDFIAKHYRDIVDKSFGKTTLYKLKGVCNGQDRSVWSNQRAD